MERTLLSLVRELNSLNDDNLAERVVLNNDVQWCLGELQDILDVIGDMPVSRLRELAQADWEGRCMVVPSDYDGEMFKIWKGQILSSRRFVNNIKELGKTVFLTRADAEAALRREQDGNRI